MSNTVIVDEISYCINNFSDLCHLLDLKQHKKRNLQSTKAMKALLQYRRRNALPKSIQCHSSSKQLIEGLMVRAMQHWCCISFKIAPIELSLLKKDTPSSILYCVAAISIITINYHQPTVSGKRQLAMDGFRKDIGFSFYQRACSDLKEVIFDDQDFVTAIQCYFCLSYTSNLLQLFNEQRTWHFLVCDILKNKVEYLHTSPALQYCWYRWYYIDAWIAIAMNEECLLPDVLPFQPAIENRKRCVEEGCLMSNDTQYDFACLAWHMRQFIRAIRQGRLPSVYDELMYRTETWWYSVHPHIHLKICYFSMRLVVLFSLLQHDTYRPDSNLLVDGLNITLEILQGLQDLKLMHCDQSTYHHMFFAIHQTLKQLRRHIQLQQLYTLESSARQQFEMNLCVLEATDAYRDDIYQMRHIASKIKSDLESLGYVQEDDSKVHVFRAKHLTFSVKKQKK